MNDQSQGHETLSRREVRRQRRSERLGGTTTGSAWIAGLFLILLGGIFLLQSMGSITIPFGNWWALFILIPAIGAFARAYRLYGQAGNRLDARARAALFVGVVLSILAGLFLLNVDLTIYGPLLIILVGLGILVNNLVGKG